MLKVKARIVDLKFDERGGCFPVYQSELNGKSFLYQRDESLYVTPFEMDEKYTLCVDADNDRVFDEQKSRGSLKWVFPVAMLLFFFAGFFLENSMFIIAPLMLLPVYFVFFFASALFGKIKRRITQYRAQAIEATIVWYKEVIKRSNDTTRTYHYPIYEYSYGARKYRYEGTTNQSPTGVGNQDVIYVDEFAKDVYAAADLKDSILVNVIALVFVAFIALAMFGVIGPLIVDEMGLAAVLGDSLILNAVKDVGLALLTMFEGKAFSATFVCIMLSFFFIPGVSNLFKFFSMRRVMRNESPVIGTLIGQNNYGRSRVVLYQYYYDGKQLVYQCETYKPKDSLEIYVYPRTQKAFTADDVRQTMVGAVIICAFVFIFSLTFLPIILFTP